jgi:hypothetical protein
MGYRLHVAKTYKVEWDYNGMFNHKSEQINTLLADLCPLAYFDGEDKSFSQRIEINKEELQEAIQDIENNNEYYDELLEHRGINCTANEFIDCLKDLLKVSDKRNDYVILEWF